MRCRSADHEDRASTAAGLRSPRLPVAVTIEGDLPLGPTAILPKFRAGKCDDFVCPMKSKRWTGVGAMIGCGVDARDTP